MDNIGQNVLTTSNPPDDESDIEYDYPEDRPEDVSVLSFIFNRAS